MKAKLFISLLFLLVFSKVIAQVQQDSIRPEIIAIVKEIAKQNRYEGPIINYNHNKSNQWNKYQNLYTTASISELRKLTSDRNAVVRCYAFDGLVIKLDTAVFSIVLNHLHDTAQVSTLHYDMGGWETVGDHFIRQSEALNFSRKDILDSVLIYGDNIRLSSKHMLIKNLKAEPRFYEQIRKLALTENEEVDVLALSRYKNLNDTGIINACLNKRNASYYSVYAVREFPCAEFYPGLVRIFKREWHEKLYDYSLWRILYQALAQYPIDQTRELLKKTIQTKDKFRYQTLGVDLVIAITKYPNPLFESLKNAVKLDDVYLEDVKYYMNNEE